MLVPYCFENKIDETGQAVVLINKDKKRKRTQRGNRLSIKETADNHELERDDEKLDQESRTDLRIPYWDTLSLWDSNFNTFLNEDWGLYKQNFYPTTHDRIDLLRVGINPIIEYIHNRLVELIPLGLHNIWFYAIEDQTTHIMSYQDFGEGIFIDNDCCYLDLEIDEMMKYVNKWDNLYFNILIIDRVWSDEFKTYCKCFQFRGIRTIFDSTERPLPSKQDVESFYPDYYKRKMQYTYPFSEEQILLRKEFKKKVFTYFYSDKYLARLFNRGQEKPIQQYIHEFLKYKEVRYAYEKNQTAKRNGNMRTYNLSFHVKIDVWNHKIKEEDKFNCNSMEGRCGDRIWSSLYHETHGNNNVRSLENLNSYNDNKMQVALIVVKPIEKLLLLENKVENDYYLPKWYDPKWYDHEIRVTIRSILNKSEELQQKFLKNNNIAQIQYYDVGVCIAPYNNISVHSRLKTIDNTVPEFNDVD